jgi:PAT family beta-lactamase induction signal transducer AmpG
MKNFVINPLIDFTKRPRWIVVLCFIICFKLSDVFAGTLTMPFLLIIEFTKTEIATIVKTFGLFATLFGVLIGGILVKKIGTYKSLWIAAISQAASNLSFVYLANIGHDLHFLYFTIFIENFSGGIGDAVLIAYLSALCNVAFSATQYATLISFATIGRSLFSSSAGLVAVSLGWQNFFIFSTFLAIPGLIFLWILRKN